MIYLIMQLSETNAIYIYIIFLIGTSWIIKNSKVCIVKYGGQIISCPSKMPVGQMLTLVTPHLRHYSIKYFNILLYVNYTVCY